LERSKTPLKTRWSRGDLLFGIFSRLDSDEAHEAFGLTSIDLVIIDVEHGNFDRDRLKRCLSTAQNGGVDVLVRLPDLDPKAVQHAVNIGADGIVIPHVDNPVRLKQLADFAKGAAIERAFAGAGRASRQRTVDWPSFRRDLSQRLMFVAQIDEPSGLGVVQDVVRIASVDAVFIGSIGFSLAKGDHANRAAIDADIEGICDVAASRPMPVGISLLEESSAQRMRAKGVNLFVVDSDVAALRKGIEHRVSAFRSRLDPNADR
jgi:staphyloferrin B biosynthesis citrate synthase